MVIYCLLKLGKFLKIKHLNKGLLWMGIEEFAQVASK